MEQATPPPVEQKRMVRIPSSRFTSENSADTNRVFLWEASENPPFVKAINGWKIVGYGKAPWPKGDSDFAVMFEKELPAGGYPSHRGEEMEEGTRIWHHMDEKWFRYAGIVKQKT